MDALGHFKNHYFDLKFSFLLEILRLHPREPSPTEADQQTVIGVSQATLAVPGKPAPDMKDIAGWEAGSLYQEVALKNGSV